MSLEVMSLLAGLSDKLRSRLGAVPGCIRSLTKVVISGAVRGIKAESQVNVKANAYTPVLRSGLIHLTSAVAVSGQERQYLLDFGAAPFHTHVCLYPNATELFLRELCKAKQFSSRGLRSFDAAFP